jgi:hypothetical protein
MILQAKGQCLRREMRGQNAMFKIYVAVVSDRSKLGPNFDDNGGGKALGSPLKATFNEETETTLHVPTHHSLIGDATESSKYVT